MNLAYKYRLYPNKTQEKQLDFMLWQGRNIYNGALEMWQECREINGADPALYDLRDYWCAQRHIEPDTLGVLPATTVDDLIRRLYKAFNNAYRRVERNEFTTRKNGSKNYGFPVFKNRYTFNSLGFLPVKKSITSISNAWAKTYLTNVGFVRVKYHRNIPQDAEIKFLVVSRDNLNRWWINYQIELPDYDIVTYNPAVGIDVGLVYLLALSDGITLSNPHWYAEGQKQRRILNRKLDRQRRANNSQNYSPNGAVKSGKLVWHKSARMKTTEREIKKLEAKIAQQRSQFWHEVTDWLTKNYGFIAVEDLSLKFMTQNKHLALGTYDASLGLFFQYLEYKCKERGVKLVKVTPAYTSQTCSCCGYVDSENRKTQADFICVACGHSENADINAAKNILERALLAGSDASVGETKAVGSRVP